MSFTVRPFTTLDATFEAPKITRSLSVSSNASCGSTSSVYSRSVDDLHDRLAAQEVSIGSPKRSTDVQSSTTFSIWSAGNLRLHGRDLTIPPSDAAELLTNLKRDARVSLSGYLIRADWSQFEIVSVTYLDSDKEEWKVSRAEF